MNEISEKTGNEELNKLFLMKIQFGEIYARLGMTWRSKIQKLRNSEYASFESQCEFESQRQQGNTEKQQRLVGCPTQHNQGSRTVSQMGDQVRRLQERVEFFEDPNIFYDPRSPSSYDSTYVSRQALMTSNSRKCSREVGMLRNTREDLSILGNVFDCQHAPRTRSWWIAQWFEEWYSWTFAN